ncbi:MAG: O-antigen ligase family protein [Solirubrobacterales bacterium]
MTAIANAATFRGSNLAIVLGGSLLGALVGILMAWNTLFGVALLFAMVYAPLAMINLPLAAGLWMPLLFLEGLPGALLVPEAGAIVIGAAWFGEVIRTNSWQRRQLLRHRRLFTLAGLTVLWFALSLIWAAQPGSGLGLLVSSAEVAVFFALIATIPSRRSELRIIAAGFVAGATLSALIGIVGQVIGLSDVVQDGRLQGAAGDPNFFAGQLVGGLALACGLLATTRNAAARIWLAASLFVLAYGIVASQSRGGFAALIVAAIAALIAVRRYRAQVLLLVAGIGAVLALWLASDPGAWERISTSGSRSAGSAGGSGREDLWTIALRMSGDHPINGVGYNNFAVQAPNYTREPGTLTGVIHVENHQEVHNAYLSLLAETGFIGLALFLGVTGACVAAAVRAGRKFASAGDPRAEVFSQSIAVALAGMLGAAFFLSQAADKRIWVLMGMAAASLSISESLGSGTGEAARADAPPSGVAVRADSRDD